MLKFISGRFMVVIAVALTLSFITFFLLNVAIDPAQAVAGEEAEALEIEQVRQQYGFDRPILIRYFEWFKAVLTGDLGISYYWNKPVGSLLLERAPETITLALMSVMVTIFIAIPLGICAAISNSVIDRMCLELLFHFRLYQFLVRLGNNHIFSYFPNFPVSGDKTYFHFISSIVLGASSVPPVMRLMRTGLLDVMEADYIRTARSNGFLVEVNFKSCNEMLFSLCKCFGRSIRT